MRRIGGKEVFGELSTAILLNSISGKTKNADGINNISRTGRKALGKIHGRKYFGLGQRVITRSSYKNIAMLRDVDLQNLVKNASNKTLSYNKTSGITLSKLDGKIKNRAVRFMYEGVKHLSAVRSSNRQVPKVFKQEVKQHIQDILNGAAPYVSQEHQEKLQEYAGILNSLVDMQMKNYQGLGMRKLMLKDLITVTTVIDSILRSLEDDIYLSSPQSSEIHETMDMLKKWVAHVEDSKAPVLVDKFFKKVYKKELVQRNLDLEKETVYPQTVQDVQDVAYELKKMILLDKDIPNNLCRLDTNVFMIRALYNAFESSIRRINLPISISVAKKLLAELNKLRKVAGLHPLEDISQILPEDGIGSKESLNESRLNDAYAKSYVNCLQIAVSRLYGDYKSEEELDKAMQASQTNLSHLSSLLRYTNAVQEYIEQERSIMVDEELKALKVTDGRVVHNTKGFGAMETSRFVATHVLNSGLEMTLDQDRYNQDDTMTPFIQHLKAKVEFSLNDGSRETLQSTIEGVVRKNTLSKPAVRAKQVMRNLYNMSLANTFAGQVVRSVAKAGLLVGGGMLTAMSLPMAMIQHGGNILLQMISMEGVRRLGFSLGLSAAGFLPGIVSSVIGRVSDSRMQGFNKWQYKGDVKQNVTFSGKLQYKKKWDLEEAERIEKYKGRQNPLSQSVSDASYYLSDLMNQALFIGKSTFAEGKSDIETLQGKTDEFVRMMDMAVSKRTYHGEDHVHIADMRRVSSALSTSLLLDGVTSKLEEQEHLVYNGTGLEWITYPKSIDGDTVYSFILGSLYSSLSDTKYTQGITRNINILQECLENIFGKGFRMANLIPHLSGDKKEKLLDDIEHIRQIYGESSLLNIIEAELTKAGKGKIKSKVNSFTELTLKDVESPDFLRILQKLLSFYAPYTEEEIPLEGITHVYNLIQQCSNTNKQKCGSAFFTELLGSCQYMRMDTKGSRAVASWIVDNASLYPKRTSSPIQLRQEITIDSTLQNNTKNFAVKTSPNPRQTLCSQVQSLAFALQSLNSTASYFTGSSSYTSEASNMSSLDDSTSSLAMLASKYANELIDEYAGLGNVNDLLDPSLLDYAYRNKLLGKLVHNLVKAMHEKHKNETDSSYWITSLFDMINKVPKKYQGVLKALASVEVDDQVLYKMKTQPNERGDLTTDLLKHIGKVSSGNITLERELLFDSSQVLNMESCPSIWNSINVKDRFTDRLEGYLSEVENRNYGQRSIYPVLGNNSRRGPVAPPIEDDVISLPTTDYNETNSIVGYISEPPQLDNLNMQGNQSLFPTITKDAIRQQLNQLRQTSVKNSPIVREPMPIQTNSTMSTSAVSDIVEGSETELLTKLYNEVKMEFDKLTQEHALLVDRVNKPQTALRLLSTYIMLDSMKTWGNMPSTYSPYKGMDSEVLQDIESMLSTMKKSFIDCRICIGNDTKSNPVMVRADNLVSDSSSFNTTIKYTTTMGPQDNRTFVQALVQQLLPFATSIYSMNIQRGYRQRVETRAGDGRNLKSSRLNISEIVQGIMMQYTELRGVVDFGTNEQ